MCVMDAARSSSSVGDGETQGAAARSSPPASRAAPELARTPSRAITRAKLAAGLVRCLGPRQIADRRIPRRRREDESRTCLSAGIYPAKSRRLSRTHGTLGGTQRESVLALRTTCILFWFFILLFVAITTDKRKKGRAWSSAPACARHDPLNVCAIPHSRSCRAPWPRRERARLQPDALSYG